MFLFFFFSRFFLNDGKLRFGRPQLDKYFIYFTGHHFMQIFRQKMEKKLQKCNGLDYKENDQYDQYMLYMKWNAHISNICTKANRTMNVLSDKFFAYSQDVKEFKELVCPVLEYGSDLKSQGILLQNELEKVLEKAFRFYKQLHL